MEETRLEPSQPDAERTPPEADNSTIIVASPPSNETIIVAFPPSNAIITVATPPPQSIPTIDDAALPLIQTIDTARPPLQQEPTVAEIAAACRRLASSYMKAAETQSDSQSTSMKSFDGTSGHHNGSMSLPGGKLEMSPHYGSLTGNQTNNTESNGPSSTANQSLGDYTPRNGFDYYQARLNSSEILQVQVDKARASEVEAKQWLEHIRDQVGNKTYWTIIDAIVFWRDDKYILLFSSPLWETC